MSGPLLEISHATVLKGASRAIDNLSIAIAEGEHTAILGPNGAGKTTLLNLLTFEDRPLAEIDRPPAVKVLGRAVWHVAELLKDVGIVSTTLHNRFVAGHNAGMISGEDAVVSGFFSTHGVLLYQDVSDAMRQASRDALERVGAGHLAAKTMNQMSTGEARRVLIARAMVRQPRALILDEPTTGLDVVARYRFLETVRQVARAGTTVILITHHVEEVIPEIERVVFLKHGRVLEAGAKAQMLTSAKLTEAFGGPVNVSAVEGFFQTHVPQS